MSVAKVALREYVPLKQGLRQGSSNTFVELGFAPRVCSTKTRIKTAQRKRSVERCRAPRVCSTKTRIKTSTKVRNGTSLDAPRVCSTKTRIKTFSKSSLSRGNLREYVPLKQGLRQVYGSALVRGEVLREYVPLKQGLRLFNIRPQNFYCPPRVCSTKTRIKTWNKFFHKRKENAPRVCSTKTRIKTSTFSRHRK